MKLLTQMNLLRKSTIQQPWLFSRKLFSSISQQISTNPINLQVKRTRHTRTTLIYCIDKIQQPEDQEEKQDILQTNIVYNDDEQEEDQEEEEDIDESTLVENNQQAENVDLPWFSYQTNVILSQVLTSYRLQFGRNLLYLELYLDMQAKAEVIWKADFGLIVQDYTKKTSPFIYANEVALQCLDSTWEEAIGKPMLALPLWTQFEKMWYTEWEGICFGYFMNHCLLQQKEEDPTMARFTKFNVFNRKRQLVGIAYIICDQFVKPENFHPMDFQQV